MTKRFLVDNDERYYGAGHNWQKVMIVLDKDDRVVDMGNILMKDYLDYRKRGFKFSEVSIVEFRKLNINLGEKLRME